MFQIIFRGHDQMRVGEFEAIQLMQHMAESLQRIGIVHVVEDSARREADAHAVSAPNLRDGVGHFQREPGAIPHRPAVFIRALVRAIAEKLIQQITVGIVNFHAVEAGVFACSAAMAYCITMPGNSSFFNARGVT
jgi:hypothetical protein